jgi:hypothetical protein
MPLQLCYTLVLLKHIQRNSIYTCTKKCTFKETIPPSLRLHMQLKHVLYYSNKKCYRVWTRVDALILVVLFGTPELWVRKPWHREVIFMVMTRIWEYFWKKTNWRKPTTYLMYQQRCTRVDSHINNVSIPRMSLQFCNNSLNQSTNRMQDK